MKKLNIGILGAGHIAAKMARTIDFLRAEINPFAIASRNLARAETMCSECGFQRAYGSYAEMLANPDLDLVYIATPNHLHRDHALQCIAAGKHVICEKPFALNCAEAQEVFDAAKAAGVFVMEALWTRFQPAVAAIRNVISSGEIGDVRFIEAAFGLAISHKERVARKEMGGGAILDLGIYPLNFAAMFMPVGSDCKISATTTRLPSGADDQSIISIQAPGGQLACILSSATAGMGAWGRIAGTRGYIAIPALTRCEKIIVHQVPSNEERIISLPFDFNGYEYEVRAAIRSIASGKLQPNEMPWSETVKMLGIMERLV